MPHSNIVLNGDLRGALNLAASACSRAAALLGTQSEGRETEAGTLVDALEQALIDMECSRTDLQRVWIVFLAGHSGAVRASDRITGENAGNQDEPAEE